MDIGWKLASAGAAAIATIISGRIAEAGWRLVTGHEAPRDDDDDAPVVQLVVFAAVSAAVAALAQRSAVRGARKWYGPRSLPKP
jgi:hypothetical protein